MYMYRCKESCYIHVHTFINILLYDCVCGVFPYSVYSMPVPIIIHSRSIDAYQVKLLYHTNTIHMFRCTVGMCNWTYMYCILLVHN